jgi:hypothetical protein
MTMTTVPTSTPKELGMTRAGLRQEHQRIHQARYRDQPRYRDDLTLAA